MRHFFIILTVYLLFTPNIYGIDFYFSITDGKSGLSHNNVKTIIQDSYGFIWFGTRNKLNRYDGTHLKIFDCYDPSTNKRNNNIGALYEDTSKKLWIGTDKGVFIFDPIKECFHSFDIQTKDSIKITEWIADIQCDQDNNIWIVVPNQGVFKYNKETEQLSRYSVVKELKPSVSNPQCIAIENNGRIWIGTNGSGVYLHNKTEDSFVQYLGDRNGNKYLEGKNIYTICHDDESIIIGVHEGKIMKLDKRHNTLSDMPFNDANYKIIRHITRIHNDEIWIGTQEGLYVYNKTENKVSHAKEDPLNRHSLSDNVVEKIYKDREGGIWLGTNFGGVNYLPNRENIFEKYFPNSNKHSILSKRVRELKEDTSGNIWIGFEDAGVMMFNPKTQEFKKINGTTFSNNTLALLTEKEKIWVGYFKNGLDIIHYPQNKVTHYSAQELNLNEESVFALCKDRNGRIWLGNAWGVFLSEDSNMRFNRMDIFGLSYTYDIIEDSEGYIWVATMGNGVFRYNQENQQIEHFVAGGENTLSSNSVSSITEDHLGQIWFSTDRGGICVYNKKKNSFLSYSIKDGLPDDITYKILEDKNYNLWFGTNQGLVRFNPETKDIRIFTQNDGLPSNQYNYKSGLISTSGKLYFGSMEGMIAFKPEEFKTNMFIPPVYITRLSVFNEEMNPNQENSPLSQSITHTSDIKLSYTQSNISFNFVSLSFTAPEANIYAYKMENIDTEWIYTRNNHSASYAKLPPGKYIFKVKGSNNDGLWNDEGTFINIEILPPWWSSKWAYSAYLLIFIAISYLSIRYSTRKYQKRNRHRQRIFEIEKEKELYEAKVNFFTDITHEIRTPVTLITGPLESIMQMDIPNERIKHNLKIIEQNTKNLLALINQLLDFRKVDSEKLILNYKVIDISLLLDNTVSLFEDEFASSKKNFHIHKNTSNPIYAIVDEDALTKIINNLLSNAAKYSNNHIEIDLDMDDMYFTLQVINDGELISDDFRHKIFEPFFQIKSNKRTTSGSGIGLSLARSLAELHNGYLFYESVNSMNVFTLKIPLQQEVIISKDDEYAYITIDSPIVEMKNPLQRHKAKKTILIVEDNKDMQSFIANELFDKYSIETAYNGIEAQNILKTKSIDIVISDIMMPQMDGFELCNFIKSDIEYSHIIVILLTAKNDLNSKIKGLELGADAYVEKPFSMNYLQTLLTSLLTNKQREMELFIKNPLLPVQQTSTNKSDEEFLNKIIRIINENLSDEGFNVTTLADQVSLSRSSLHRRIKVATDMSPLDFIRFIRMQRAAQLIIEGKHRINEICDMIGITTPSYFIKLFQNQYGMTPKEFEMQQRSKL